MAATTELFTRGGPDMADNRGQSMVAKHLDKLQKNKEDAAVAKLKALMPHVGPVAREMALQECGWDTERALALLRKFALSNAQELSTIQKVVKSDDDNRRSKKHGKSSKKRDGKRHSSSKSKKKHKHKRSRSGSEDRPPKGAVGSEYGKHGIIRETDMYAKRPEFMLWAIEVKKIDVEIMPKFEEKELFREYMEDYNTATLPHQKYYDTELYERQRAAKAAKRAAKNGPKERTAFEDEAELKAQLAAQRAEEQRERLKAAYGELHTTDKAKAMREQELMRAQMTLAYRMGDHSEAQRLAARLAPDDPSNPHR
ncbi:hypothetical protein F751_2839 [Auxenochlorella protothecoides]|uniref:Uncharacterized protein n=1 Tax=Auxenochlorella protothecoides TaxID=3075 RepID=A0A087SCX6_AUXPR|nr:hypothetical protein F751_2839 [Auxenochlorella protothecoides]KFM23580.1 hypothetical protein F751_2839 [Auxenochlorella protothecoides]